MYMISELRDRVSKKYKTVISKNEITVYDSFDSNSISISKNELEDYVINNKKVNLKFKWEVNEELANDVKSALLSLQSEYRKEQRDIKENSINNFVTQDDIKGSYKCHIAESLADFNASDDVGDLKLAESYLTKLINVIEQGE